MHMPDLSQTVSQNLKLIMKQKKITQKSLAEKCMQKGLSISQGTISNVLNNTSSCSISTLEKICVGLDIEISQVFSPPMSPKREDTVSYQNLITNPSDSAFRGYLQTFHVYFYQTAGKNSELLQGELTFSPSQDKTICKAHFILHAPITGSDADHASSIEKIYTGSLSISLTMQVCFCELYSDALGEMCFLIFKHFYLFNSPLTCIMANAITTSSGVSRRPTVHRICLSSQKLSDEQLSYLKGQLLLNGAEIVISDKKLEAFKKSPQVSKNFLPVLENAVQRNVYHSISESRLMAGALPEQELIQMISLLRSYSSAPKYSKVSAKTDENLFILIEGASAK
ncbi:MAG: helix-turn-helix domain-containing protein [Lachnospiraceae bacterium]